MLRLRRSTLNCRMMFCIPPGRLDTIPHERAVWEGRGRREERREEGGGEHRRGRTSGEGVKIETREMS